MGWKGYDTSNNVLYELKDGMGIIIENNNDFYEYIDDEVNDNAKFSYNTNCQSRIFFVLKINIWEWI